MSNWPLLQGAGSAAVGRASSPSGLIAVTSGVADTKGGFTELIASTPHKLNGFWLHTKPGSPTAQGTSGTFGLVDIAIGAAGSEVIILENVFLASNAARWVSGLWVPLEIPAGVRVSARWQCSTASEARQLGLSGVVGGVLLPVAFQRSAVFGANTATSRGTNVDAGTTANTPGSWTEFSASAPFDIKSLLIEMNGAVATGYEGFSHWLGDVGVGAAGSEQVVLEQVYGCGVAGASDMPGFSVTVAANIPAGARIAVRGRASGTGVNQRTASVVLHAFG